MSTEKRDRDFAHYGAQMDASLSDKLEKIQRHVKPGIILDYGCGTGMVMVKLAEAYPDSHLLGIDQSSTLVTRARQNTEGSGNIEIAWGDYQSIYLKVKPDTIIFSSVLHEVFSQNNYSYGAVQEILRWAYLTLPHGGRVIIRDGVMPLAAETRVLMRFMDTNTQELFIDFSRRFKQGLGCYADWEGKQDVFTTWGAANEFLCKKDYVRHWDLELDEQFAIHDLEGWHLALAEAGFRISYELEYVNPWIRQNRYQGKVRLYSAGDTKWLEPYPSTNMVMVADKA